jgi:hypothetical protein
MNLRLKHDASLLTAAHVLSFILLYLRTSSENSGIYRAGVDFIIDRSIWYWLWSLLSVRGGWVCNFLHLYHFPLSAVALRNRYPSFEATAYSHSHSSLVTLAMPSLAIKIPPYLQSLYLRIHKKRVMAVYTTSLLCY